jgi:hypothetical protein
MLLNVAMVPLDPGIICLQEDLARVIIVHRLLYLVHDIFYNNKMDSIEPNVDLRVER